MQSIISIKKAITICTFENFARCLIPFESVRVQNPETRRPRTVSHRPLEHISILVAVVAMIRLGVILKREHKMHMNEHS